MDFDPAGLQVALRIPGRFVVEAAPVAAGDAPAPAPVRAKGPDHVLVVEDNIIIALDLEGVLLTLGAGQMEPGPHRSLGPGGDHRGAA